MSPHANFVEVVQIVTWVLYWIGVIQLP